MTTTTTTFNEMRDTILQWCLDITGRDLVLANAGEGPKPGVPYVEVYLTVQESPNYQTDTLSVDGLTETITAVCSVACQLDLYGGDAMQDASKLCRSLKSARRWLDLWIIIGLQNIEALRDLTALETGTRKQRAQVVINFTCCLFNDFDSDYFDQLPITIQDSDGIIESDLPGGTNPNQKAPVCFL